MKKARQVFLRIFLVIILIVPVHLCFSQEIKLKETPDELAQKLIHNPAFVDNANGENFCWHAKVGLDRFVENYDLTKDSKWLDAGIKYYDFLISKMETDPDGYKGWIGVYGYDNRYWQDALVGDAILFEGILNFSVLVLEDKYLMRKYRRKATAYVELAKRDFIEKWDKRGCWVEDGPYGTYIGFNKYLKSDDLKNWIVAPGVERSGVSHPFNKQMDVGAVCLRLLRITGDKFYRERAEKIYFTVKSHFQYFDDHYCWNYFEPLYPGDVDLEKKTTLHGVWVHMWRSGYQAGEVEKIAEAYHYGIVFDEQDIKRIINTNLHVMWNKDTINPKFINSNGLGADGDTIGVAAFKQAYGHSNVIKNGGELWTGLIDFDQRIRDLYAVQFKNGKKSKEWLRYKNTVLVNPPGFKRKFVKGEVTLPKVSFTESKELSLATVLPHVIQKDKKSIIICQSWIPGNLSIDLYAISGEKEVNIYQGKIKEGMFMITWDGKDPTNKKLYKGDYKIRWTIGTGYREFPVSIK